MEKIRKKIHQNICNQMSRLRNANKQSQETVARILGVTQTTYGRYEAGTVFINAVHLYQLACYYHVNISDFFRESDQILIENNKPSDEDFLQQIAEYITNRQFPQG